MLWEAEVAFVGCAEYLCPLWQGLRVTAAALLPQPRARAASRPADQLP